MPKKLIKIRTKKEEIDDWKIKVLEDGIYPENTGFEGLMFYYDCGRSEDEKLKLYESIQKDFIKDWIDKYPTSRPWGWYRYTAPRQNDDAVNWFYHGTLPEERKHISGGRRCEYNYVPKYYKGIFEYWHYTNDDMPMFESEAAYLKRLDLLTDSEKKHLEKHPELLKPETIESAIPGIEPETVL
jgi:hypothetical protein